MSEFPDHGEQDPLLLGEMRVEVIVDGLEGLADLGQLGVAGAVDAGDLVGESAQAGQSRRGDRRGGSLRGGRPIRRGSSTPSPVRAGVQPHWIASRTVAGSRSRSSQASARVREPPQQ